MTARVVTRVIARVAASDLMTGNDLMTGSNLVTGQWLCR